MELLKLRQRFDENQQAIFVSDLQNNKPKLSEKLMTFNNFGICQQVTVSAAVEGLGRIRAVYQSKDLTTKSVESELAEIAVYKKLETTSPQIPLFFSDLYTKKSVGQLSQEF